MNPLVAPEALDSHRQPHTALSVNVNKVATLRNTRHLGTPGPVHFARLALEAGAAGITVHPRPDERHIRAHDVFDIAALIKEWPQAEFNIEGNPFHNLMDFVRDLPQQGLPLHQVTFVPDGQGQFTSDHGWDLQREGQALRALIAQAQAAGARVSLFMDPLPEAMPLARALGADRVELYTEPYAAAAATGLEHAAAREQLQRYAAAARAAHAAGLGVNAGHDLNLLNLGAFLQAVPGVAEVSIGHALIGDALELGVAETVRRYNRAIRQAHSPN